MCSKQSSLDRLSDFEIGTSNAPQATDRNCLRSTRAPLRLGLQESLRLNELSNFSLGSRRLLPSAILYCEVAQWASPNYWTVAPAMKRRPFIAASAGTLLIAACLGVAHGQAAPRRIGLLSAFNRASVDLLLGGLRPS